MSADPPSLATGAAHTVTLDDVADPREPAILRNDGDGVVTVRFGAETTLMLPGERLTFRARPKRLTLDERDALDRAAWEAGEAAYDAAFESSASEAYCCLAVGKAEAEARRRVPVLWDLEKREQE